MASKATAAQGAERGESPGSEYSDIFLATPAERIDFIRKGVPARTAKRLSTDLKFDQYVVFDALNLKTSTVNKKAVRNQLLSPEDGERVVGLAKLIGQLEVMVEGSDHHGAFDAAGWLSRWLREPLPALGGDKPIDLLDTMEGQGVVSRLLSQIESGVYA